MVHAQALVSGAATTNLSGGKVMSKDRRFIRRAGVMTALAVLALPLLAACGGDNTPTPPAPTAAANTTPALSNTTKLKVGLVTDVGRLNDKSFNQSSWEGVQQAQSAL